MAAPWAMELMLRIPPKVCHWTWSNPQFILGLALLHKVNTKEPWWTSFDGLIKQKIYLLVCLCNCRYLEIQWHPLNPHPIEFKSRKQRFVSGIGDPWDPWDQDLPYSWILLRRWTKEIFGLEPNSLVLCTLNSRIDCRHDDILSKLFAKKYFREGSVKDRAGLCVLPKAWLVMLMAG